MKEDDLQEVKQLLDKLHKTWAVYDTILAEKKVYISASRRETLVVLNPVAIKACAQALDEEICKIVSRLQKLGVETNIQIYNGRASKC